jgi:hypothetical protein
MILTTCIDICMYMYISDMHFLCFMSAMWEVTIEILFQKIMFHFSPETIGVLICIFIFLFLDLYIHVFFSFINSYILIFLCVFLLIYLYIQIHIHTCRYI